LVQGISIFVLVEWVFLS